MFSLDYPKMTKAGVEGADVGAWAGMEGNRLGRRARGGGSRARGGGTAPGERTPPGERWRDAGVGCIRKMSESPTF